MITLVGTPATRRQYHHLLLHLRHVLLLDNIYFVLVGLLVQPHDSLLAGRASLSTLPILQGVSVTTTCS